MDKGPRDDNTSKQTIEFNEADCGRDVLDDIIVDGFMVDELVTTLDEKVPRLGMEFESESAAFRFYNDYAKATGFGVRMHHVHRQHTRVLDRIFCCECEGYRKRDKRDLHVKRHQPETRTGCGAKMKINGRGKDTYTVVEFVAEHTGHDLVSPKKAHMLRSHRNLTSIQAAPADDLESSGIAPKEGFALMSKQVGGRENLLEDYRNYLRSKRTIEMNVDDTRGVLEYMQQTQCHDPNFFYTIQIDNEASITNILWVDARMKSDFSYFGDVVSFDTTYRKSKEDRPFAIFVGVNHHKQTIIFAAALLFDETASTFMWLFDSFAKAMSEKKPVTILTDQDAAMAKALASQWPETYHRLCIWHIYQNAAIHLSHVFASFKDFAKEFSSCIYD
ncbi:hypothetical protein C2S51_007459 [Perilla frutescens var. frutescens]|nr:hypothetical protein C2S51_007459 [Perilla frutescens var. frutescens]